MATIGISLASEEHGPRELVRYAAAAREHGFHDVSVSDHFHPWVDAQGQSPFAWTALGAMAVAAPGIRLGTAVTCPTTRLHPALVAQAAATASVLTGERFFLGVGSGEALNEHVLGDPWPAVDVRLARLEEAVAVMRALWEGDEVTWRGEHFTVENARLYSVPERPIPLYTSAFGPAAAEAAARIGGGLVTTTPSSDLIARYRAFGGRGSIQGSVKVCWAPDERTGREQVARLWPTLGLPGELAQLLPTPAHFEEAVSTLDEEARVGSTPCGPDPDVHVAALCAYLEAGFDELFVHQVGRDQEEFLTFYRAEILPRLSL